MLVFCYHNGALGHATMALIETCTKEGNTEFPSFFEQKNLHHFKPKCKLFRIRHPDCDINAEHRLGNTVACSTSSSYFGRHLVLLMGLKKWIGNLPDLNQPVTYKQYGQTYGEQLEIIALTLKDKVVSDSDWFMDADCVLDIVDYWTNTDRVAKWLALCGYTPVIDKVTEFCNQVSRANQYYHDIITKCFGIVDDVTLGKVYPIEISFYETAICHSLLLQHYAKSHIDTKLFSCAPTSTQNFIEIFNG